MKAMWLAVACGAAIAGATSPRLLLAQDAGLGVDFQVCVDFPDWFAWTGLDGRVRRSACEDFDEGRCGRCGRWDAETCGHEEQAEENGVSAVEACCVCGGGTRATEPPGGSEPSGGSGSGGSGSGGSGAPCGGSGGSSGGSGFGSSGGSGSSGGACVEEIELFCEQFDYMPLECDAQVNCIIDPTDNSEDCIPKSGDDAPTRRPTEAPRRILAWPTEDPSDAPTDKPTHADYVEITFNAAETTESAVVAVEAEIRPILLASLGIDTASTTAVAFTYLEGITTTTTSQRRRLLITMTVNAKVGPMSVVEAAQAATETVKSTYTAAVVVALNNEGSYSGSALPWREVTELIVSSTFTASSTSYNDGVVDLRKRSELVKAAPSAGALVGQGGDGDVTPIEAGGMEQWVIILLAVAGVVVLSLLLLVFCLCKKKKEKEKNELQFDDYLSDASYSATGLPDDEGAEIVDSKIEGQPLDVT